MLREEKREIREMGEVEAGDDDGSGRVTLNPFGRWLMTLTSAFLPSPVPCLPSTYFLFLFQFPVDYIILYC
jgi:hypothetical protein